MLSDENQANFCYGKSSKGSQTVVLACKIGVVRPAHAVQLIQIEFDEIEFSRFQKSRSEFWNALALLSVAEPL